MNIEAILVYDPATDGLDFAAYEALRNNNPDAAFDLNYSLLYRVLNSRVGNRTLKEFLFDDDNGYFSANPNTVAVVFANGRGHSQYTREGYKTLDLDALGRNTGAIPFAFTHFPELAQYFREREAIDALSHGG